MDIVFDLSIIVDLAVGLLALFILIYLVATGFKP